MDTTKNDGAMPGFDEYKNSIDGSDTHPDNEADKKDDAADKEDIDEADSESLNEELDQNFPLSGGGTEPIFDNEGA